MRCGFGCLEPKAAKFFHSYGLLVSQYPFIFLISPILVTCFLATGLIGLEPLSDALYLYTPTDAPSKTERRIIHDAWPLVDGTFVAGRAVTQSREVQVAVVARNDGNILEKVFSDELKTMEAFIRNNITVEFNNRTWSFPDLCLAGPDGRCANNDHIQLVSRLYHHGINITYPTVRLADKSAYIASALGGVKLAKGENNENIIVEASAWLLIYQLKFYPNEMSYISGLWEKEFKNQMDSYKKRSKYISITYFHSQTLSDELKRNAERLAPKFIGAFVILVCFSVLCSIVTIKGSGYIDWVVTKPILSVLGVSNAGMGIASAMGMLTYMGIQYNDIIAVMPFLVVAVGTDNMFLMVASLKRTDRNLKYDQRIAECMADAAVSILITALTDALSFGVGTITTIPAVQIFCIYTMCALLLTFAYQLTFFCAVLVYYTRIEEQGLHSIWLRPAVTYSSTSPLNVKFFWLGSQPPKALPSCGTFNSSTSSTSSIMTSSKHLHHCTATSFFRNWYAPVLMQPWIRAIAGLWYLIYLALSIYGCSHLKEGLEPANLLVDDSYATPHYRVLERHYWHYGASLQIVVNNAPDFRNPVERINMDKMASTFANSKVSIGDEGVQFWLREMQVSEDVHKITYDDEVTFHRHQCHHIRFYDQAAKYIYSDMSQPWVVDVVWGRNNQSEHVIKSYRFMIGMRDISTTTKQTEATNTFREIASRFERYNVTTYMPLWLFTDQYALVVPNTMQDIVVAVACMLVISALLIPQPVCSFWVAVTIGSIDLGVLGFMTLWGVNLDAISMITIIMSVGFSVDYSAHITYAYVISKETTTTARVCDALGDLGWPVAQGAMSTILAVSVLSDVPAYMIVTFFKTVFLAISIGFLHGLVFLPLMLSVFVGCCSSKKVEVEPIKEPRFMLTY
ncbi:Protein CBG14920 [Caenorhabditis briggsae]|uniref:Protein CBG14920 n=1 Tax=Caenorhabditis briggsae TaxID=6238 RepID=A8XL00_CAEBR|nr:Protein CBG14920 [Caenorhabditis briggsae]CAP33324.2 Protein CBG14920 [Caenorhabditis briggsae]